MPADYYLNMNTLPVLYWGNLRRFNEGVAHVSRRVDYDVLLIMLKGRLVFYEDGKRVTLKSGEWYIQRAGLFQEGREPSEMPVYHYFHFRGDYTDTPEKGIPLSGFVDNDEIRPLLDKIYRIERSPNRTLVECSALFYSILVKLGEKQLIQSSTYTLLKQIEMYMLEHYDTPLTLEELAQQFQLSKTYIIRLFRTHHDLTPHQYLTQLRIEQSCRLLQSTEMPVCDIAYEVGYSDVSSFYRAFTQRLKISPSKWRSERMFFRIQDYA